MYIQYTVYTSVKDFFISFLSNKQKNYRINDADFI